MKAEGGRYEVETVRVRLAVGEPGAEVGSPADAIRVLRAVFADLDADQEHFVVLALDTKHRVTGYKVVASGAMDGASIDLRVVFRSALLLGAADVIVAHNHPSGDPEPSADDMALTRRLTQAGHMLGIEVLDHVILGGPGRHVSLKMRREVGT